MSVGHLAEYAGVATLDRAARAIGWRGSLALGARLGAAAGAAGLRRRVAAANLAVAFPEKSPAERRTILAAHYRELGRVALEYPHLPRAARTAVGEVVAAVRGHEHLERVAAGGGGAIFMSGHFGNFELMAAFSARYCPMDLVVKPLSNPRVDDWLMRLRRDAGFGLIRTDAIREVFAAVRAGRGVAMLADQDARRHGVFVPFFGRPSSTPIGPARLAIALGVPILMGFCRRRADGRHEIDFEPPLVESGRDDEAALRLTARHTAIVEGWVRRHPEMWFWLHRRWKTAPPAAAAEALAAAGGE